MYLSVPKHIVQTTQRLRGPCENDQSTDRTVQSMHNTQEYCSGFGILLLDIQFHRLGERGVAGLVALHDLPCTLRDDDYVVIFV